MRHPVPTAALLLPMRRRGPCLRPRTLRGFLTLTNVCLLGVGLVLTAAASVMWMNHVLMGEVDHTLRARQEGIRHTSLSGASLDTVCRLAEALKAGTPEADSPDPFGQDPFLIMEPRQKVPRSCSAVLSAAGDQSRQLSRAVSDPVELADSASPATFHTGGDYYRATAGRLRDGTVVITGIKINGVRHAVHKVLVVEWVVGAGLLGLLATLCMAGGRRKLRPLEDMVRTASAIADGDLSRRVNGEGHHSDEVAQLATALNSMLHQIEGAFQTRERATAQLRQFVADASHELRTPLASIRGYLQLYEQGILDEAEQCRALRRVNAEAERMGHLVDELLALARLDQRPELVFAPVDLAGLVADGAADLRAQQPRRPVELHAEGPVPVLGEEAQLRQVVANLLGNVRTHTPEECRVAIGVRERDGQAVFEVADRGPGMRARDAARIFDRFFRADPDRARRTGGSGLGMSIVQAVVEAHGGTVSVSTAPEKGLAVRVRLPLRSPAGAGPAPAELPEGERLPG